MIDAGEFFNYIKNTLFSMGIIDFIDIIIVSVIIYYTIKFIRDKRAAKLLVGIVLLGFIYLVSSVFKMNALSFILTNVFQIGLIAFIIVFQPELRSALEKMGGTSLNPINRIVEQKTIQKIQNSIDSVVNAALDFSATRTGALIVIERTTKLGDFIKNGTILNADTSATLLKAIFVDKAPLHDGAVIISQDKIEAAGCYLTLSSNDELLRGLGTRHRAGLGISENSDAVTVIISEESGIISIAVDGNLERNLNEYLLRSRLHNLLIEKLIIRKNHPKKDKHKVY